MPKIRVDDCPAGPALDAAVARVLGREVLGMVACYYDYERSSYIVPNDDDGPTERPVYLAHCACEFRRDGDIDYFGHVAKCLETVDDYSENVVVALGLVRNYRIFTLDYFGAEAVKFEARWRARIASKTYAGDAYGHTHSLAITRAFLMVNEIEYIDVD